MNLKEAIEIIRQCERGLKMAGRYFDAPFTVQQLVDAGITLLNHANLDAPTKDELTLANRRWAAVNAQLQKVKKRYGIAETEEVDL